MTYSILHVISNCTTNHQQHMEYKYQLTRKFSPPMGGFFLAPAEGKNPSGPKVTLPDRQTDGRTDKRFKGVRL